jgi:peptidoglycan hydrolase CwlO-like protein
MKNNTVNIFLLAITIVSVIVAVVAWNKPIPSNPRIEEYEVKIKTLNDSIRKFEKDITGYKTKIDSFEQDRKIIKNKIKLIKKEYEKTNRDLINGNLDYHIRFLADYLSKKDSVGY